MDAEDLVRDHYSRADLQGIVFDVLEEAGIDPDSLRVDDLAGLDQLHAGGQPATEYVLDCLDLEPGVSLLDVGCGVGGPARMAAARHGCQVTGVDLTPDFIDLARALAERMGMGSQVTFDVGSGTNLAYADGSFARAMMIHVGMNIADKAAVFGEVRRVLEPGGLFAVYDQMRTGDGEITYPQPWADTTESSFVEPRERYRELLEAAGFNVERDDDRTAANASALPLLGGGLNPGRLAGPDFAERVANNISAAVAGTLSTVVMVARAV